MSHYMLDLLTVEMSLKTINAQQLSHATNHKSCLC